MNIKLKNEEFQNIDFKFQNRYFILFPSSIEERRMYNNQYFAKTCNYLCSKYNLICFIVGSKRDSEIEIK